MSYRNQGIHPNIGSIIRIRDQIYDNLYVNNNPTQAIDQMDGLMRLLNKEDRDPELHDRIRSEKKYYTTTRSASKRQQRITSKEGSYGDWFMQLNDILWEKDYLLNRKYDPMFDPSGGQRSV